MTDAERNRRWRAANPEKIKAQRERRRLRKLGLLPPVLPPTPEELEARIARKKAKAIEYNRAYRARNVDEVKARQREAWRKHYRLKKGIPLDADLKVRKYATDEERRLAKNLAKRKADAKARGTTLEEIEARKLARAAAKAEQAKLREAESTERRRQRNAEKAAAAARKARRDAAAKAVQVEQRRVSAVQSQPKPAKPVNTNDPPELVALFAKANKGYPVLPYRPGQKKPGALKFRGFAR